MATVTQDVGVAGSVSATVTFDNATGAVSFLTVVNNSGLAAAFKYLKNGTWRTFQVAAGSNQYNNTPKSTFPALVQGADGTWDWDYTTGIGWELDGA